VSNATRAFGRDPFAFAPVLTLALFVGPIVVGLFGTFLPAFGLHPALGEARLSLAPWRDLFFDPSFPAALRVTVMTGFGATIISMVIAVCAAATLHGTWAFSVIEKALAPALAFPHASFAVGAAFLFAPSGWIARLLSPWLTGWDLPPDILILRDPNGVALMVALILKEILFLVLLIIAAFGQTQGKATLHSARAMGYGRVAAWLKAIFPQIYPQIRLPVFAVLAASFSAVDVALILGPTAPPPLAPLTLAWYGIFDVPEQMKAAAASVFQFGLVGGAIGLWRLIEIVLAQLARPLLINGRRSGTADTAAYAIGAFGIGAALAVSIGAIVVLAVWSFAEVWRWPDAFPAQWSFMAWREAGATLGSLIADTAAIAAGSSIVAIVLVVLSLESGMGWHQRGRLWLIYIPLLTPQISFLFGVQVLWSWLWLDGTLFAVIWTHLLFVLPYVLLVLSEPYRALDPRIAITARALGAGRWRTLLRVKVPLLARPIAIAIAIGFAVSVGQYLPTLFAGVGRIDTLATEAVALASGADRRLAGVVALSLTILPFLALLAALLVRVGPRAGLSAKQKDFPA
jgi:putative thiamine transport system permease protein